jgi:hypothetical protein
MVFSKLRSINLKLNPEKCCFGAKETTFLGHVVDQRGFKPDPAIIHVSKFQVYLSVTNVHSFLGLT